MKICVAGAYGAFGLKHLDALKNIDGVEVTSIMGPTKEKIEALAAERGINHFSTTLEECIKRSDVEAVILSTPTQMHADQAIACMEAGKHVLIEIPMADTLEDSARVVKKHRETGLTCMAGQVRRFNPSHQWIKNKIDAGELKLQQMDAQTYFFRRTNTNAKGEPRSVDRLPAHRRGDRGAVRRRQAAQLRGPLRADPLSAGRPHPEPRVQASAACKALGGRAAAAARRVRRGARSAALRAAAPQARLQDGLGLVGQGVPQLAAAAGLLCVPQRLLHARQAADDAPRRRDGGGLARGGGGPQPAQRGRFRAPGAIGAPLPPTSSRPPRDLHPISRAAAPRLIARQGRRLAR